MRALTQSIPVSARARAHAARAFAHTAASTPPAAGAVAVPPPSQLRAILEHNKRFVERGEGSIYVPPESAGDKVVVVVSCMDTRLTHLLPAALGIRGSVKFIKNAGAVITSPFGGIMRSIMVAVFALGADEIFVVGHHDCGMTRVDFPAVSTKMIEKGITRETLRTLHFSGVNVASWLEGFSSVEESVRASVGIIRNHPLTPSMIPVHGLVIHPRTGHLDCVIDGYDSVQPVAAPPVAPVLVGGTPPQPLL